MSMAPIRVSRALAGAIAILVTLSCGGGSTGNDGPDPNGPPQPPPAPPAAAVEVSMVTAADPYGGGAEQNYFSPNVANLTAGGTVTWSNETTTAHNVTFASASAPASIGNMANDTEARTFPNAGTFNYQCTNHAGMTGTINVQ